MEKLYVKNPLYPPVGILFSLTALMTGLFISKEWIFMPYLSGIILFFLLFGYGKVLIKCLIFIVILCMVLGLLSYTVTSNIYTAAQTVGRLLLFCLCAIPLISMPPINLTRSMEAYNCPRAITLGMLVAIRFIPVFITEMKQISEAMKTRGIKTAFNPLIAYRAFLIPLMMRVVNISEILSLSLETRGFDLSFKDSTTYKPVRFTIRDGLFLICVSVLMISALVVKYYE